MFITLVQDFNSVGGDSSRRDIHFMQVQPNITTIWSERWWTTIGAVWAVDWNNERRTVVNLQGEIGHRLLTTVGACLSNLAREWWGGTPH